MSMWKVVLPLALALIALPAFSETIVLQNGVDGYEGTQDSHIISWDGSQNQLVRNADGTNGGNAGSPTTTELPQNPGGHNFLEEGDYGSPAPLYDDSKVILIQFDLSGVSAPSVANARVELYYWFERSNGDAATEGDGSANPHTLNVNRILKAWGEGDDSSGVDGADAADNSGVVTLNSTGTELWQAMGAEGPEDVAPTESTTYFDPNAGGWVSFDVTESVNLWLADPSPNNGVKISQEVYPADPAAFLVPDLVLADGTIVYVSHPTGDPSPFEAGAYDFVSSENTDTPELRPKLVIATGAAAVGSTWYDGVIDSSVWGYTNMVNGPGENDPPSVGSAAVGDGMLSITNNGWDQWDASDGIGFLYQVVSGDFDVAIQVVQMDSDVNNPWEKAGICFRQTLDPGSAYVSSMASRANGLRAQYRLTQGGGTDRATLSGAATEGWWVRLTRTGDVFDILTAESVDGPWLPASESPERGLPDNTLVIEDPGFLGVAYTPHSTDSTGALTGTCLFGQFVDMNVGPVSSSSNWELFR